ncbi:Gp15 family bacteriophage protein [Anaerotruncus rubiinfantis]|uniref:Gp15 family bacteriophage protein n=1 Tax=Anaerotruncus rubiinfantis TaxID=1720200 RepID=UPI00189B7951
MNLLVDDLPYTVEVAGTYLQINTDFRIGVLFELLMQDSEFTEQEKLYQAIQLYFPVSPHNLLAAADALLWFYRCGKDPPNLASGGSGSAAKRIYSFEHDDTLIYAAFRSQYGIDLTSANLHWWQFRAMFSALTDENEFVKVMGYRAVEITSDMTPSRRQFYARMKVLHKLPDNRTDEEKSRAFAGVLAGGLRIGR